MLLAKLQHIFLTDEFMLLYWLVFNSRIYQEVLNETFWVIWRQSVSM